MKIGLISDTHGYLDPSVPDYFRECDEIWHAGDIGEKVADELRALLPLRAVHGNIDDLKTRHEFPEDLIFDCCGQKVLMTHIAGTPPRLNPRTKKLLQENRPDLLICGHSHIARVMRLPEGKSANHQQVLYINPGAAGQQGFHRLRTIMRMEIIDSKISALEVIELGKRGAPTS